MSLKYFHIVFISASIILLSIFSLWCYQYANFSNTFAYKIASIISLLSGISLIIYEIIFIRKT